MIHKTFEFSNKLFRSLRFNEKKRKENLLNGKSVETLTKTFTTLQPHNIYWVTLILGMNICIV